MLKLMVTKRSGNVVEFDIDRIRNAITRAVTAIGASLPEETLNSIVQDIASEVETRFQEFYPNVENIQDLVEKHLVLHDQYEVVKAYILYRQERRQRREEERKKTIEKSFHGKLRVTKRDGATVILNLKKLKETIVRACRGYEEEVSVDLIMKETIKNLYDGVKSTEIEEALVLASASFIERDPAYSFVASRLFLQKLQKEVVGRSIREDEVEETYRSSFIKGLHRGVEKNLIDPRLLEFDLDRLAKSMKLERDENFRYLATKTLYERYFMNIEEQKIEMPQSFWMRVAMGLAVLEKDKNEKALEFYEVMSAQRFVPSTPTLFHSGSTHPQLSSCYLTTIEDDLKHIFKSVGDNAQLSKWSGGIGNDWSNIRATGSMIKSTNVESQGVVPFLKIANDVTVAINRSGKRRGATCAYLETWHLDIEDFLELRKNTGDERRRTHDMNTANWIPDLFMKRIINDEEWTLFSPSEVPELHSLYGSRFEKKYEEYEKMAENGKIRRHRVISARKLWRKMLTMLFETGHPWITFKDACNIRSPQDHVGVVNSSNLCTEIALNTSSDETAVCNLGSVNLSRHIVDGKLDRELVAETVSTAMRMLDNVIDINFYPTVEAKNSNLRHRPVGLGIMGLQDALYKLDVNFDAPAAFTFVDNTMELISYHAILGSSKLAKERGAYESFEGSKWSRGIFPVDTLKILSEERGMQLEIDDSENMDWMEVREHVKEHGMRNSNCMAIAPTATISNIAGCYPSIEPIYKNIYVKANISGEFTIINSYLVDDLKKLGLWNKDMLEQIKYHDGNLQLVPGIPDNLKEKYKEAFEIDPLWCLRLTAARSKWIDQSQSHNVFMKGTSGKFLSEIYTYAWKLGLKTTYYLRTLAASQIEKSTLDAQKYGFTQKREYKAVGEEKQSQTPPATQVQMQEGALCRIDDPDCEACQ